MPLPPVRVRRTYNTFVRTGTYGHSEEVSENSVRDPLLLSIDDVVLTVFTLLRLTPISSIYNAHISSPQIGHVASRVRFRNTQADDLLSLQTGSNTLVLKEFASKEEHGG